MILFIIMKVNKKHSNVVKGSKHSNVSFDLTLYPGSYPYRAQIT